MASSIEANIAARQRAESIIELIGSESPRFWECLAELVDKNVPKLPVTPDARKAPMDDAEAATFEKLTLQWGKYSGEYVGDVPCGYLLFLAEGDEFTRKLRRYTASKVFALRQDEESEE